MAIEALVQFFEESSENDALRKDLAGIIGIGDGDISSADELDHDEAQALLGGRGVLVATFADQQGFEFTVAELNAVVGAFQRYRAGEFSDKELASALGLKQAPSNLKQVDEAVGAVYRGVRYDAKENSVSSSAVLEFMKETAQDAQLRGELQAVMGAGDGDISSFEYLDAEEVKALKSERGALVAEFAAQHGFVFTMADLLAVTDLFQRVQSGELSESEGVKFLRLNAGSGDFFPFIEKVTELTYKGFKYSSAVPSSAQDNTLQVVNFMEKSESDNTIRSQLQAIIGGDGNISNPAELDAQEAQSLQSDRCSQIVELGAEHGFRFTVSDLNATVGAFQLVNSGELSAESCARILGLGKTEGAGNPQKIKETTSLMYRGIRY